jgi:hypothetical protein
MHHHHIDDPLLPNVNDSTHSSIKKQTFLDPDKYQLLKAHQQKVYEQTEVSPTLRKLVNALITEENLAIVVEKIISALT